MTAVPPAPLRFVVWSTGGVGANAIRLVDASLNDHYPVADVMTDGMGFVRRGGRPRAAQLARPAPDAARGTVPAGVTT